MTREESALFSLRRPPTCRHTLVYGPPAPTPQGAEKQLRHRAPKRRNGLARAAATIDFPMQMFAHYLERDAGVPQAPVSGAERRRDDLPLGSGHSHPVRRHVRAVDPIIDERPVDVGE